MKKLIEILEIQRPSGDDKDIRKYLMEELATVEGCEFHDDGDNIYASKGIGPYPCVVAHMDAVHKRTTGGIKAVEFEGKIFGMNPETMTQCNIGADDGVGIYVALRMLRVFESVKVVFFRDEEIGCRGSALVDHTFFSDATIVLQCDRRGNSDFVIDAGTELSSKEFQNDVLPIISRYGYAFSNGMMTDVLELKEQGINISMANISCGYYNPHMSNEYVVVEEINNVTDMVYEIISTLGYIVYPHTAPDEFAHHLNKYDFAGRLSNTEIEWWKDSYKSNNIHSKDETYCTDCWQSVAVTDGMCQECYDYYNAPAWSQSNKYPSAFTNYPVKEKKQVAPDARMKIKAIENEIAAARKRLAELTGEGKKRKSKR